MKKQKTETLLVLRIIQEKSISNLTDLIAGRAYTIDGVCDVTAHAIYQECVVPDEFKMIETIEALSQTKN